MSITLISLSGAQMILNERKRQVEKHGYDGPHDDDHTCAEIADAAAVFLHAYQHQACVASYRNGVLIKHETPKASIYKNVESDASVPLWPWSNMPKISKNKIRNLVKAGALIAAEIDRLGRLH